MVKSNFGADAPAGPVVINVISRAGTANYHGQVYLYARNAVLNANTWQNKHNGQARPDASYYYPGIGIGGPIQIPHTNFGKDHKLLFWAGFEDFRQTLPAASALTSFVPTAAMRAGNFSLTDPASPLAILRISSASLDNGDRLASPLISASLNHSSSSSSSGKLVNSKACSAESWSRGASTTTDRTSRRNSCCRMKSGRLRENSSASETLDLAIASKIKLSAPDDFSTGWTVW